MTDGTIDLPAEMRRAAIDTSVLEVLHTGSAATYYLLPTSGVHAIELWTRLREIVSRTAYWPVLIGDDEDLDAWRKHVRSLEFGATKEILKNAESIDPAQWLAQRYEEFLDEIGEFGGELYFPLADDSLGDREEFRGITRGPWPEQPTPSNEFLIPLDLVTKKPLQKVNVMLVPTSVSWHVPAYLRFGGFNECPGPEVHAALMRHWHDRFGAEVVSVTRDVVEMRVGRPPSSKADALWLAKQQYLYCQDIVDQGTQTLESLAACLLDGTSWFFWWD